uniref:UBA domain-containing protein n=1 Tax=Mesocestoides corti TaxID=53468 RepID=A0A5K3FQ27_MESCO
MGFGNESRIKEALLSCENDVDSAITFLVNDNFGPHVRIQDGQSSEKDSPSVTSVGRFPVEELKKLEDTLYVEKWNIPCLRSQSLGICLLAAIQVIKNGGASAFTTTDGLERFMNKCLNECLSKFLTSSAVLQWDADTLEGVHNMLELVIQLAVECLAAGKKLCTDQPSGQTSVVQDLIGVAFAYLEAIFNPECSYHQRCRDRSSNIGNYIDSFNNWSSLSSSETGDGDSRHLFAEPLPAPKNFYLVNLLNCFGVHGGFELIRWYVTRHHFPLKGMQSTLGPLANVAEYLTMETMCRYASWPIIRTLWLIHNLTSEDCNPQESRIFDLVTSVRVLCYRFASLASSSSSNEAAYVFNSSFPFTVVDFTQPRQPDWDSLVEQYPSIPPTAPFFSVSRVDERHLAILLASLCPPAGAGSSFKVRMLACRHLIDQLSAVQQARSADAAIKSNASAATPVVTSMSILAAENQAFLKRRKVHKLIRYDVLMTWVR